jgi:hypothetical protein
MNITYRPLETKDLDSLINLIKLRPHVFNGYSDKELESSILDQVPVWLDNPLYYVPGIFMDNQLCTSVVLKESEHSPSWTWGYWISRPGTVGQWYTSEGVNAFKEADTNIFNEMETNRKLKRIFLSYRTEGEGEHLKSAGMSERMFRWMSRQGYRSSNYTFVDDCVVEPNQEAKYSYQRAILGNRTWPFKTTIRIGFLIQ